MADVRDLVELALIAQAAENETKEKLRNALIAGELDEALRLSSILVGLDGFYADRDNTCWDAAKGNRIDQSQLRRASRGGAGRRRKAAA